MKLTILTLSVLLLISFSCDTENDVKPEKNHSTPALASVNPEANTSGQESNTPVHNSYKMTYAKDQATIVDLNAMLKLEGASTFELKSSSTAGQAEIVGTSYLKYSPETNTNDFVLLNAFDEGKNLLRTDTIFILLNTTGCGLAVYDSYKVKNGETLTVNVLSNDLICESINDFIFSAHSLELARGMSFSILPRSITGNSTQLQLTYTPNGKFRGKVKAIYTAAINIKDEYREVTSEFMAHPEYFSFFGSGLIEIEVTD